MVFEFWHGTNQAFDSFSSDALGLCTRNAASEAAFFFASDRAVAVDYARHAARTLIPQHFDHEAAVTRLLRSADDAMRRGRENDYEAIIHRLERLEAKTQEPPSGATVLLCKINLERVLVVDGGDRRVVADLGSVLEDARSRGHDGVLVERIFDTPTGRPDICDHLAVFDASAIEIMGREPVAMEDEPDIALAFT